MRRTYYNNTSFLDLLFNFLLATVILLVIAVSFIITEQNKADIEMNAEFVITLEWDGEQNNDVDIWIEDPYEKVLWYRNRETGVMHNDRDDKGHIDDVYKDGRIIRINQEIVTFRGILEGDWTINVHLYRVGNKDLDKLPTDVTVTMIKLNPRASIVFKKEYEMVDHWDQITVARFYMTESGEILDLTDGPFKDLIQDKVFTPYTTQHQGYGE
jgi:hypothetical protein